MFQEAHVSGETNPLESVLPAYWCLDMAFLRAIFVYSECIKTCPQLPEDPQRLRCSCLNDVEQPMMFVMLLLETTDGSRHFRKVREMGAIAKVYN